jgi:hypothetical protein
VFLDLIQPTIYSVQYCSNDVKILPICLGFGGSCHQEDVPSTNNQIMQGL